MISDTLPLGTRPVLSCMHDRQSVTVLTEQLTMFLTCMHTGKLEVTCSVLPE